MELTSGHLRTTEDGGPPRIPRYGKSGYSEPHCRAGDGNLPRPPNLEPKAPPPISPTREPSKRDWYRGATPRRAMPTKTRFAHAGARPDWPPDSIRVFAQSMLGKIVPRSPCFHGSGRNLPRPLQRGVSLPSISNDGETTVQFTTTLPASVGSGIQNGRSFWRATASEHGKCGNGHSPDDGAFMIWAISS